MPGKARILATFYGGVVSKKVAVVGSREYDKYFKSATVFSCPPKCDAGGPPEDDGHLFNIPVEEECFSGARCKCGMTNMDFDMWRLP